VTAYSGTYSLESAQIGDSQSSLERFDVMGGSNTTVSFWLYTSSEAATQGKSGDAFIVSVDGLEQKRWTGTTPWLRYTLYLGPGQHTVQLEYTKDASGAAGMDAAFVDDLEIRDEPRSFPLFPALAPLQTSGDQPFIVLAPGTAALTDTLAPGEQALLTLPVAGYARDIAIGAWIDTQLANPDKLEVLVDGNVIYTLDYTSPLGFWPLDVPKGSHTVEWLVTRDASSTGSVNVTVQSVSVIPKACP
jgi:hypothetical protein